MAGVMNKNFFGRSMNKKQIAEKQEKRQEALKWSAAFLLLFAAFVAQCFFKMMTMPFKAVGWVIVLISALAILSATEKGKALLVFIKEGRIELQKVVWPTRKEAVQIALIVLLVVCLAGILLWGVDSGLVWSIGHLTQLN